MWTHWYTTVVRCDNDCCDYPIQAMRLPAAIVVLLWRIVLSLSCCCAPRRQRLVERGGAGQHLSCRHQTHKVWPHWSSDWLNDTAPANIPSVWCTPQSFRCRLAG